MKSYGGFGGQLGPVVMKSYDDEGPAMGKGRFAYRPRPGWGQKSARVEVVAEVDIAEGHKSTEVAGNWARVLCA
ncbi:hypothetical protein PS1_029098 [Malus domestica]